MRRSSLPKTENKFAPATAVRLTVFGASDIVSNLNESDVSAGLSGIPVQLIPTKDLIELREKIEMVSIASYVFLHCYMYRGIIGILFTFRLTPTLIDLY